MGSTGRPWLIRTLVLLAAVTAGIAIVFVVVRPQPALIVENELVEPIAVVAGSAELRIAPDSTGRVALARGRPVMVTWFLVRPTGPDGQPMGEGMQRVIVAESRGTVRRPVDSRSAGEAYFAPLITNHTDQPLRIMVNAGLSGARDCGCAVRPGATRVRIGYYRLFANSTVRATDPAGSTATFRGLGPQVDPRRGTVGLRFNAGDLRAGGR